MIREICEKIQFPEEAASYFESCFQTIRLTDNVLESLYEAMDLFFCDDSERYTETLDRISQKTGMHRYSVDGVFLLLASKPMKYLYKQHGYSEELYWENLSDLKSKLLECKAMYHIWGTSSIGWFHVGYRCKRFQLGRLQFEKVAFRYDHYKDSVKKGDLAFKCHIPSCGPLIREDVLESFKKARDFYRDDIKDGPAVFVCSTWLLYPPHYEVFPEHSNLRHFQEIWDIIDQTPNEDNHDFWRVFYREYDPNNLDDLPSDTVLQKNFIKFFKEGNCMGTGFGVYILE